MKKSCFYLLFFLFFLPAPFMYGQRLGDIDYGMYDRNFEANGQTFRVRRIPQADFQVLFKRHAPGCGVVVVSGLNLIQEFLADEYTFWYDAYGYTEQDSLVTYDKIYEIRKKDELRILLDEDIEGGYWYYPEFHVFQYVGGHQSDSAVDLLTGERTDAPASWSPDGTYCLTEMYTGHDSHVYKFKRWNRHTQLYETIAILDDVLKQVQYDVVGYYGYLRDYFWLGSKLYFRARYDGSKYMSITMP